MNSTPGYGKLPPGLSPQDVSDQCGVTYLTVMNWINRGVVANLHTPRAERVRLRAVKVWDLHWRIDPADLDEFLAAVGRTRLYPRAASIAT